LDANVEAAEMHMDAMKKIIAAAGGMESFSHGTLAMLYWYDLRFTVIETFTDSSLQL
jgi:hypothetical protein